MPEEMQEKGIFRGAGLFGPKKPAGPALPSPSDINEKINSISSRLRISEERSNELRRKLVLIEQNMISNQRKNDSEAKSLYSDLVEIKHSITEIQDRIITIIKEIKTMPRKEDVDLMTRYVELWNPVKFVRIEHIEKIIKEKLEEINNPAEE